MSTTNVTSSTGWKKKSKGEEVVVPSGNTALVKRVSIDVFLRKGVLPNSFMPIIENALKEGKAPEIGDVASSLDIDKIEEIMGMYDAVLLHIVIEPHVLPVPPPEEARDPDGLYVDDVDLEDKVFLFNWAVGGTADVEAFRKEQAANLAIVRSSEDMELETEFIA